MPEDIAADRSYPFIIFRESDGAMIGGITLANVRRGIVQAGTIGYWVGQPHADRGYMTTSAAGAAAVAVRRTQPAPHRGRLHPSNAPSIRVLEKCGFSREGLARRYLCINGVWQDHSAVRPAARGFSGLTVPAMAGSTGGLIQRALGSPPLRCYKAARETRDAGTSHGRHNRVIRTGLAVGRVTDRASAAAMLAAPAAIAIAERSLQEPVRRQIQ